MHNLILGLENMIYYLSTIWTDRTGDFAYIETLELKKLLRETQPHKSMKICIEILQRRRADWYYLTYNKTTPFKEEINLVIPQTSKHYQITSNLNTTEKAANARLSLKFEQTEKRDWNTYCEIKKKYHNTWWN